MDWLDYLEVDSDDSLFDIPTQAHTQSQPKVAHTEWTSAENELFENTIAELDPSSPLFFENLALSPLMISKCGTNPWLKMLRTSKRVLPENQTSSDSDDHQGGVTRENIGVATESSSQPKKKRAVRRKGVPWTPEEHRLFLMGLKKFGKGHWRSISRHFVVTKSPTQIASHAQKYYCRLQSTTPTGRRRPSIHDIQIVNCTPISVPPVEQPIPPPPTTMYNHHKPTILPPMPKVVSSIQISMAMVEQPIPPPLTTIYKHRNPTFNAISQYPNHIFQPTTIFTSHVANSMMINRPASGSNPSPYMLPPSGNQYWS